MNLGPKYEVFPLIQYVQISWIFFTFQNLNHFSFLENILKTQVVCTITLHLSVFEQKNFPEPLKVEQFLNSQSFEGSNENKETLYYVLQHVLHQPPGI